MEVIKEYGESVVKDDGSIGAKNILAMITHDNVVIAGDSGTTSDSFDDLYSAFGDKLFTSGQVIVRVYTPHSLKQGAHSLHYSQNKL